MSRHTMLVVVCAVLTGMQPTEPAPQFSLPCKIVSVYDGDTATAELTLRMNVRLLDCWAPEVTGPEKEEGLKSKATLERLVLGKDCTLQIPLQGNLAESFSFGRVLGRLFVGGEDVSRQMVEAGAATARKGE